MWLVLFNLGQHGQQWYGPQLTQAETQLSLINNHVQLYLRPVSISILIVLILTFLLKYQTYISRVTGNHPSSTVSYLSMAVLSTYHASKRPGILKIMHSRFQVTPRT